MAITAALVKELREKTGLGMMDCKKALVETDGDVTEAVTYLRKKGLAASEKKSGRIASEGIVTVVISDDKKSGVMVEVNCETDFVVRNEKFQGFAQSIATFLSENSTINSVEELNAAQWNGETVENIVSTQVAEIGEKIIIRRFNRLSVADGHVGSYIHAGGKIGVLISLNGGDDALLKDLALQVASQNPLFLDRTEVSEDVLNKEREINRERALAEGKPEAIVDKMVEGRLNKYFQENCLLEQEAIKEDKKRVKELLKSAGATIEAFIRFEAGEGIEKKEEDFAGEVMAQIK